MYSFARWRIERSRAHLWIDFAEPSPRESHDPSGVGFDSFAPYLTHSPYFETTAGRCANRIRDGHLELDSIVYQLDQNFLGKHHLHGGAKGIGKRLWQIAEVSDSSLILEIALTDGEMGYAGNMQIQLQIGLLSAGVLDNLKDDRYLSSWHCRCKVRRAAQAGPLNIGHGQRLVNRSALLKSVLSGRAVLVGFLCGSAKFIPALRAKIGIWEA